MKLRMDKTLSFWVDCSYEDKKYENANRTKAELIAEILREYERPGDAMRYLNAKGQIAWKAGPWMLSRLADVVRDCTHAVAKVCYHGAKRKFTLCDQLVLGSSSIDQSARSSTSLSVTVMTSVDPSIFT